MNINTNSSLQKWLLIIAGAFVTLYSAGLTIATPIRQGTWSTGFEWQHWIGWFTWIILALISHRSVTRFLKDHDPYLLPAALLLTGWGLLSVYRLFPVFGIRQTAWFVFCLSLLVIGVRFPSILTMLRRFKYIWLTTGILLVGLTLLFGTNPSGAAGQRLWLGCCGIYFQPSEPLKLLFIIYLAAYLADRFLYPTQTSSLSTFSGSFLAVLAPTGVMTGIALVLLIIQRDLGTGFIFIFLYASILFMATNQWKVLFAALISMLVAMTTGYFLVDVVRIRIIAWFNPWLDPSGSSYQIVQSLIAIANGEVFGRGPGLGNPGLVPVPHSDFIFTSITEETGLSGAIALLLIIGIIATRGFVIAFRASGNFRRYLAAGLTVFLVSQSLLIIGGNIRMVPLTGVTLPFISYGGSSLLVTYISLLLLLLISADNQQKPAPLPNPRSYTFIYGLLVTGILVSITMVGWWTIIRSADLLVRTDNQRRYIADLYVRRGSILDRKGETIVSSEGERGQFERILNLRDSGNVIGYTKPGFGQAGLEEVLDPILRGTTGYPFLISARSRLLYGVPEEGFDVRLTLDLEIQEYATRILKQSIGATVVLESESGRILAMASSPGFDANTLEQEWQNLATDPDSPLLNRATQSSYPVGSILGPFLLAEALDEGLITTDTWYQSEITDSPELCEEFQTNQDEPGLILAKCPNSLPFSLESLPPELFTSVYLDYFELPISEFNASTDPIFLNPIRITSASASISNGGVIPVPFMVSEIKNDEGNWQFFHTTIPPIRVFSENAMMMTANILQWEDKPYWAYTGMALGNSEGQVYHVAWFLGGTLPGTDGTHYNTTVVLEDATLLEAATIGLDLLERTQTIDSN